MIMELTERIFTLVCIAMAVSTVALTVTKAVVFRPLRELIGATKIGFLIELFSCPYCFSFWVAALFQVIHPFNAVHLGFFGYLITYFATIAIAAIVSGIVFYLFTLMEPE